MLGAHDVLVVEDDDDMRLLVQLVLRRAGFDSDAVSGGQQALDAARSDKPGLVLLDVGMPDLDGLEVCRRLKADAVTADSPVLMISSATEDADVRAGYDAGADGYLNKPFSARELVRQVNLLLPGPA